MALFRDDYIIRCKASKRNNYNVDKPYLNLNNNKNYSIKIGLADKCVICGNKYNVNKLINGCCINCIRDKNG